MVRGLLLSGLVCCASLTAAAFETTVESPEIPVLLSNGRLTALVDDALAVPAELRVGENAWPNAIVWEGRRMTAPGFRLTSHGRFRPLVRIGGKSLGEPTRRVQTFDTGRAETRIVRTFADGVTLEGAAFVAADENVIALRLEAKGADAAEFDLDFEQPTGERIVASLSEGAFPRRFRMKSYGRTVTETAVDIVRLDRGPCAADFLLVFADSAEKAEGAVEARLAASVGRLTELGYEGLRAAHRESWARYYREGSCVVPDERILRMREMAEYQLRCCVTDWSIPVGMVPNMWEGKIFAFDEMYAVQGLLSAGHLSSAARATDYRRATLMDAHARNGSWGWNNYRNGHSFGARWVWQAMEDDVTEGGRSGFWLDHVFHMATVARSAWLQYRFADDLDYLRETSYPVMIECARYFRWNCLYENPADGSLFFGKCTDLERLGPARERATLTTVGAIHTLRHAAEASALLATNAVEAADLRACADRLERSLAVEDGRFLAYPGCAEESMGTLAGFFPFPVFPREHPVMRKTVEHFLAHGATAGNMYAVGKQVCPWYAATMSVAAGMTGDRTAPLRWIGEAARSSGEWGEYWEINEKGGARMRPWFMTAAANTLYAIDRLFVADADGEIRIAFHVPDDWRDFSFTLPSEAGVTVRAVAKDGRIVRLELLGSRTSGSYRLRLRSALLPEDFVRNFNILSRADEQGETVLTVEPAAPLVLGYMLDISRDKVPTQAMLRRIVDILADLGYNQFQLYSEHTFAYRDHETAWRDASPLTPAEIRELDDYCARRGIELVPNQNSFGHLERWFEHDRYRPLAEIPEGNVRTPWGRVDRVPHALCPTDPKSLAFVASLYDELLPNFRSRLLNVGCDEVWDISSAGRGRSWTAVTNSSPERVWLDYLRKVCALAASRGRVAMFWDDMLVRKHPELIPEIPSDAIALDWGYEIGKSHSFESACSALSAAGLRFYACPGASGWNAITGRYRNMKANVDEAVAAGLKHGAEGFLMTDWGNGGHCQPWITALPALVYMAGAVRGRAPTDAEVAAEIDRLAGARCGAALLRYQDLYLKCGVTDTSSRTELYTMLAKGAAYRRPAAMTDAHLAAVFDEWRAARATLSLDGAQAWARDGFATMDLLMEALELRAKGEHDRVAAEIPPRYRELWLRDNRPGGLEDSVAKNFGTGRK